MMSKYEWKNLGDVATITKLAGFEFTKHIQYKADGEIIALRALNIRNGVLDLSDVQRIDRKISEELPRSKLYINDIIFTYTGNGYGDAAIIKENDRFHLAPNVAKITPNDIKPYFLFKFIKSKVFYQQVKNHMVGSSQPTIPMKTIRQLKIPYPDMKIQLAIATTLSFLDDKIELNNNIDVNLEAQAQSIFKSWFVDFEPFYDRKFVDSKMGPIPEGWQVQSLTDVAQYLNGLAMQKFRPLEGEQGIPVLKIKELRQGNCDTSNELCSDSIKSEYIVNDGDVVFSWSGSLLVDIWCGGKCGLNQHLFKVTSNNYDKWFYYFWTKHYLDEFAAIAAGKATTMGHIKRGDLENSLVVIPDERVYKEATALLSPMIEQIITNRVQSRSFAALRDTLLPKLMSGEIEIPIGG